jgi:adenylate cyclase
MRLPAAVASAGARIARIGADPADDDEARLRKSLLVFIALLILPISLTWWLLYLYFGSWTGWFAFVYFVISVASIVVFSRNHDEARFLRVQVVSILLLPTVSMVWLGGVLPAGGVGLWAILAPLGALVFGGVREGVRWYVAFLVAFVGFGVAGTILGIPSPVPEWFSTLMLVLNVAVGGTIVFTLLALFAKQRHDALAALRVEQDKAENLLLNILPRSIAEKLKADTQTIADSFGSASILFADVVDFTPLAQRLPPSEVVGILDRLFSYFDSLADRYGLEKIKTIGDCYMVAAGVPTPRPDHAEALARMAVDMREAMRDADAVGDLGLELRIGINSGPVVAGVIGRKRFLYDLWGDAVNTASRMESHGSPGQIQITRATYELVRDEFACEPQGTVEVKGKGKVETWYVVGPRAGGRVASAGAAEAGLAVAEAKPVAPPDAPPDSSPGSPPKSSPTTRDAGAGAGAPA